MSLTHSAMLANACFAKFGDNVKSIEIAVKDVNGPRGGVDKECHVLVKLKKAKVVSVTVKDESLAKAIPNTINRAVRSVGRQLARRVVREVRRLPRFSFEV